QKTGTDVEHADLGARTRQRVDDFHLVRDLGEVDDLSRLRMEALQRAARKFGIEGARRHTLGAQIIEHGTRDGRLSDPALVGADDDDCWFHLLIPQLNRLAGIHPARSRAATCWLAISVPKPRRWQVVRVSCSSCTAFVTIARAKAGARLELSGP